MSKYVRKWINLVNLLLLLLLAINLVKMVSGKVPISCDNNPCTADVTGCTPTGNTISDICCVDLDKDGKYHCAQCKRDQYKCGDYYKLGSYYDCQVIEDEDGNPIRCRP